MHEREKLEEAKYFYSRMIEEQENRKHFTYNLSAFLSSARSVLLYALNEAKNKTDGHKWYNDYISASTILKFFKDKRNFDIHTEPIKVLAHHGLSCTVTVRLSDSCTANLIRRDEKGNIIEEISHSTVPEQTNNKQDERRKPEDKVEHSIKYVFDDWTGDEDILTLSKMYIQELENFIGDGVNKNFITG